MLLVLYGFVCYDVTVRILVDCVTHTLFANKLKYVCVCVCVCVCLKCISNAEAYSSKLPYCKVHRFWGTSVIPDKRLTSGDRLHEAARNMGLAMES